MFIVSHFYCKLQQLFKVQQWFGNAGTLIHQLPWLMCKLLMTLAKSIFHWASATILTVQNVLEICWKLYLFWKIFQDFSIANGAILNKSLTWRRKHSKVVSFFFPFKRGILQVLYIHRMLTFYPNTLKKIKRYLEWFSFSHCHLLVSDHLLLHCCPLHRFPCPSPS